MAALLHRLTTEYVPREDRLRLSGVLEDQQVVVVWLTRRLLDRLLPLLVQWLTERSLQDNAPEPGRLLQGQAATQATDAPRVGQAATASPAVDETPVSPLQASKVWLASSVDVARGRTAVALTFLGEEGERAMLQLTLDALRKWLQIIQSQYRVAEWDSSSWALLLSEFSASEYRPVNVTFH